MKSKYNLSFNFNIVVNLIKISITYVSYHGDLSFRIYINDLDQSKYIDALQMWHHR